MAHAIAEVQGFDVLAPAFATWTMIWLAVFYALCLAQPWWVVWGIPVSAKAHENNSYWCARNVFGLLHAALVAALAVPAAVALWGASDDIRFVASPHLNACAHPEWVVTGETTGLAGLVFTAFIAADVVISVAHGLATWDFVVHHAAFLMAGVIIRRHCMLPFNSAILLAMEASTPFLNFTLFFCNRGPAWATAVKASGFVFFSLFIGALLLWSHRETALPQRVPSWERSFLLIAVAAGAGVQFFWFPVIAKVLGAGLVELIGSRRRGRSADGAAVAAAASAGVPGDEPQLSSVSMEVGPLECTVAVAATCADAKHGSAPHAIASASESTDAGDGRSSSGGSSPTAIEHDQRDDVVPLCAAVFDSSFR